MLERIFMGKKRTRETRGKTDESAWMDYQLELAVDESSVGWQAVRKERSEQHFTHERRGVFDLLLDVLLSYHRNNFQNNNMLWYISYS